MYKCLILSLIFLKFNLTRWQVLSRWSVPELPWPQENDRELSWDRHVDPFQFPKKSKVGSWAQVTDESHVRSGDYISIARAPGDSVICVSIVWTAITHYGTGEAVRCSYSLLRMKAVWCSGGRRWTNWEKTVLQDPNGLPPFVFPLYPLVLTYQEYLPRIRMLRVTSYPIFYLPVYLFY